MRNHDMPNTPGIVVRKMLIRFLVEGKMRRSVFSNLSIIYEEEPRDN